MSQKAANYTSHDSILKNLTYLKSVCGNLKKYVDIPGFKSLSVITEEERWPDIVIRETNKFYIAKLTVRFETRVSINAERKLKHYESLCKERMQGFWKFNLRKPIYGRSGIKCKR